MSHTEHFLNRQQLSESDSFILFYLSQILVRDEGILWSLEQISDHLDDSADLILLQRDADTSVIAVSLQQNISVILQARSNLCGVFFPIRIRKSSCSRAERVSWSIGTKAINFAVPAARRRSITGVSEP